MKTSLKVKIVTKQLQTVTSVVKTISDIAMVNTAPGHRVAGVRFRNLVAPSTTSSNVSDTSCSL